MTLDTSALIAILEDEPEREEFISLIDRAALRQISALSVLEASLVLEGRQGLSAGSDMDRFLRKASIRIIPFDHEQLSEAREAFRRFGKGRHRAGLNFGDCASYALAQCTNEPLLFKGVDFSLTDVPQVPRPA